MRRLALAGGVLAAGLGTALALPARADSVEEVLHVSFESLGNERPSHFCIVSTQAPADEAGTFELPVEPDVLIEPRRRWPLSELPAAFWKAIGAVEGAAIEGVEAGEGIPECGGAAPSACEPFFDLRPEDVPTITKGKVRLPYWAKCKDNRDRPTELKVAFAFFSFGRVARAPEVKEINLDGTAATVTLERDPADAEIMKKLIVTLIGGHYLYARSRIATAARVDLPLVPRCSEHDVQLPAIAGAAPPVVATLTARSAGAPEGEIELACTPRLGPDSRFKMDLPYLPEPTAKRLRVAVGTPGQYGHHAFETSWYEFEAPAVVNLSANAISFAWRRDCLYPKADGAPLRCPDATLVDVGLACRSLPPRADDPNLCRYVCAPEAGRGPAAPFGLPARVRFRRPGSDEAWEDRVSYGNQQLSGYVAAADRHVEADFARWGADTAEVQRTIQRRAANIFWIAVRDANGTEHFVAPGPDQRIAMPGVRCGDILLYRTIGDRDYFDAYVAVDEGRLVFDPPEQHEVVLFPGLAFGAGGIVPLTDFPVRPFGFVRGILGWRPPGWQLAFELRGSYMLSAQSYIGLSDTPWRRQVARGEILYNRYALDPTVVWTARARLHFGLGAGVVLGHPWSKGDFERAGGAQLSFAPTLFVRSFVSSGFSIETLLRVLVAEDAYEHATDFTGTPSSTTFPSTSGIFELGLRFGR